MFFVKLLRFLRGTVLFKLTGGFSERFINLCGRGGIPLWDFTAHPLGFSAHTTAKGYKRMRPYAKKTGVKIRIQRKEGVPFLLHRYRKRTGLLAGLLAAVVLLGYMSGFVWKIEVTGNEAISTQEILAALDELGFREGTRKHGVDARELEQRMILKLGGLSWIGVNIQGSTARVEVRERTLPPDLIDQDDVPTNVVAAEDGQIIYLEVYDGQAVVALGDTVMQGDLIVSGITEDKHGNSALKHARAKVVAQVVGEKEIRIPLEETLRVPTGEEKQQKFLSLGSFQLPISFGGPPKTGYETKVESSRLTVLGRELPLVIETRRHFPYYEENVRLTAEQAKAKALSQLADWEKEEDEGGKIIDRTLSGQVEGKHFVLNAQYIAEKNIEKLQEILIKE